MMKFLNRFWHGETNGLTSAALVVGFASLASRLFGILRDRALASTFGAGSSLDAYYAAFRLPDLLYNLIILGALSAGFIPVFTEYIQKKGESEAWRLAEQVLSVVGAVMLVACGLLSLLAPILVPLTVPGFPPDKMQVTVELSRIMFLSPLLLGLSAVMGGILQATRRFVAFSLAPVFYNLGIIFGTLVLARFMGLQGVAWGVVIGAALHLIVQAIVVMRLGLRQIPMPSLQHSGVRRILYLMAPRTAGLAVSQLNTVILLGFASHLENGSVSVFNLATNLQSFPVGIIGVSYAIAVFPLLARSASAGNREEFVSQLLYTIRKITFLILPITALFFLLRPQIVRLILGAGQFDWDDTIRTANVFGIFLLSLLAQCYVAVFARAFYAIQDTRSPFWISLWSEAANVVLAFVLYREFGIQGLAISFTVATFVNAIWLWSKLSRVYGPLGTRTLFPSMLKAFAASVAIIGVGYPVRNFIGTLYPLRTFWQVALQAGLTSVVALAGFILVAWLLKSQELVELTRAINRKMFHVRPEVSGAEETHDV
jgi:putative peptidoglycan lipid II flippase